VEREIGYYMSHVKSLKAEHGEFQPLRLQGFHMGHVVADLPLHKSSCEDKHVGKGLFTTGFPTLGL
jgi:hypothetical protein